jgi:hypothetical protein
MYLCVRGTTFTYFYGFSIEFWECFDSVVFVCLFSIALVILFIESNLSEMLYIKSIIYLER